MAGLKALDKNVAVSPAVDAELRPPRISFLAILVSFLLLAMLVLTLISAYRVQDATGLMGALADGFLGLCFAVLGASFYRVVSNENRRRSALAALYSDVLDELENFQPAEVSDKYVQALVRVHDVIRRDESASQIEPLWLAALDNEAAESDRRRSLQGLAGWLSDVGHSGLGSALLELAEDPDSFHERAQITFFEDYVQDLISAREWERASRIRQLMRQNSGGA